MNTQFVCKFGRGGRRGRKFRRAHPVQQVNIEPVKVPEVDLRAPWTVETAKLAFALLKNSGQTQKAFAEEHGFPASRFTAWKKKLAA